MSWGFSVIPFSVPHRTPLTSHKTLHLHCVPNTTVLGSFTVVMSTGTQDNAHQNTYLVFKSRWIVIPANVSRVLQECGTALRSDLSTVCFGGAFSPHSCDFSHPSSRSRYKTGNTSHTVHDKRNIFCYIMKNEKAPKLWNGVQCMLGCVSQ